MPRFFVPRAELGENFLVLTGENAAHARVLRLKNGDAVTVCDGEGEEWHCVVSDVAPGQVSLVVQEHTAAKSEAAVFCSVYMAFAKADKFEHVIQKATELGAAELVAFPSARCVSRPDEKAGRMSAHLPQSSSAGRRSLPRPQSSPGAAASRRCWRCRRMRRRCSGLRRRSLPSAFMRTRSSAHSAPPSSPRRSARRPC